MASWLEVAFAGHYFVLDAELGLFWSDKQTLVVSDLHLEKSTFLAQFGSAVAPYDSLDTLARLQRLIDRYRPRSLILLGDSFHDKRAWERLDGTTRTQLLEICASIEHCCFVEGNHDVGVTVDPALCFVDDYLMENVLFSHEPAVSDLPQVIGHFHPKLKTSLYGHRLVGKCFAMNERLLIMPAFGSFTGGLDLTHEAFAALAKGDALKPYLVYGKTISAIYTSSRAGRRWPVGPDEGPYEQIGGD